MNHQPMFAVSRFETRNGVFSFRVDCYLNGVRIRRNFKTQEEAAAEKAALELKALQMKSNLWSVTTCLAEDQVREAESLFRRAGRRQAHALVLRRVRFGQPPRARHRKSLDEAIAAYLAVKIREHQQKLISESQLTTIRRHMTALKKRFPGGAVADLTAPLLTPFFQLTNACLKTYNNRRGLVSTFLKFAEQQDCRDPHRRPSTGADGYVEGYQNGRLVAFFALCPFAGIRPCLRTGEILRLLPAHIRLDTGVSLIEPEVSKVGEKRTVTIQPNLVAWLRAYPLTKYPIIIPNL